MTVRTSLLLGLVFLLLTVGGGLAVWPLLGRQWLRALLGSAGSDQTQGILEKLEVYGRVPDFSLIERSGRRITLADLAGKVWIANFFYSECTDTCPLQSANMARLQADFAGEKHLRLVSITVDPEHDTPEILSEYAAKFRADPERWLFLTGARDVIYELAIEGFRLGVVDQGQKAQRAPGGGLAGLGPAQAWAHPVPNPERKPIIHSSRFVLVDRQARIRGYYHGTEWESLERLSENVRVLLSGIGSAGGTEDPFVAMGVQRPANPYPAPDLRLPNLNGRIIRIKDFGGKVVLLGFFTTT